MDISSEEDDKCDQSKWTANSVLVINSSSSSDASPQANSSSSSSSSYHSSTEESQDDIDEPTTGEVMYNKRMHQARYNEETLLSATSNLFALQVVHEAFQLPAIRKTRSTVNFTESFGSLKDGLAAMRIRREEERDGTSFHSSDLSEVSDVDDVQFMREMQEYSCTSPAIQPRIEFNPSTTPIATT